MFIAMALNTAGDIFIAKTSKTIGIIHISSCADAISIGSSYISQGSFWLAILFFAGFFFLWLKVLSYEELSFALPMTALAYIFNAILAGPLLHETVTPLRWAGTICIGIGVMTVAMADSKTKENAGSAPSASNESVMAQQAESNEEPLAQS
nr:DMT family transporter [bacterium]